MSRAPRSLLFLLTLLAAFAAQGQTAVVDPQVTQQDQAARRNRDTALPASVRRVERETGGEVISAEPVQRNGREVYHLKVLTPNGRVRTVQEDPQDRDSRRDKKARHDTPEPDETSDDDGNNGLQP